MINIIFPFTFLASFLTYALLRQFDVASTREFSKYLDMDKHEVNPLINWLLKRGVSLNRSFTIMLFLFGVPIALGDALLNTYLVLGVPFLAWGLGCFHVVASANNYGYLPSIKKMNAREIREQEANMFAFGIEYGTAKIRNKIKLLCDKRGFEIIMTALSVVAFIFIYYSIISVGLETIELLFFSHGYFPLSSFNMGLALIFALLAYYPVRIMSIITMANRYNKLSKTNGILISESNDRNIQSGWVDIPTNQLKNAITMAEENNSKVVRVWLGSNDSV
jgi:hypothetical protein